MDRYSYQTFRFKPGYWNGLFGGVYKAQYFRKESGDRVAAMMEIVELLRVHGISFSAVRWKEYYRICISADELEGMSRELSEEIFKINKEYMADW